MAFTIWINGKAYTVGDHAANRMVSRFISEDMIIATVETGRYREQPHGVDLYEKEFFTDEDGVMIIRVAVDESQRTIVTVIDLSDDVR